MMKYYCMHIHEFEHGKFLFLSSFERAREEEINRLEALKPRQLTKTQAAGGGKGKGGKLGKGGKGKLGNGGMLNGGGNGNGANGKSGIFGNGGIGKNFISFTAGFIFLTFLL